MKRIIIFLIRRRLGLKYCEKFRFTNQKTSNYYYFTKDKVIKIEHGVHIPSSVSLNWLLDDECEIVKFQ